jgi:hypothetical protein
MPMTRLERGDNRFDRRILGQMNHDAVARLADFFDRELRQGASERQQKLFQGRNCGCCP